MKSKTRKFTAMLLAAAMAFGLLAIMPVTASAEELTITPMIAGGEYHSLALKYDGTVWAWGYNLYGQLGDGTKTDSSKPLPVMYQGEQLSGVAAVAAGDNHSLALSSNGDVFAWGSNGSGQLGNGTTTSSSPLHVEINKTAIAAGGYFSLALDNDGTVMAWGSNSSGQLGVGFFDDEHDIDWNICYRVRTTNFTVLDDVTAIAAGYAHSMALKSDGTVYAWGNNSSGQLGDGTTTRRYGAVRVETSAGVPLTDVVAIAAGSYHSLALKSNGTVWVWGNNSVGQLGNSNTNNLSRPMMNNNLSGVTAIAAGYAHSMALKSDGRVLAWGRNSCGQLGNGTIIDRSTPVHVMNSNVVGTGGSGDMGNVIAISAGNYHSFAVKSDGPCWGWGYNACGQLGNSVIIANMITYYKTMPVRVNISNTMFNILYGPYALTVIGGTGSGSYLPGSSVSLRATPPAGMAFDKWVLTSGGGTLANANSASTTFTMPPNPATVTATYKYILTVTGGSGSGNYSAGDQVPIAAAPSTGQEFVRWKVTSGDGTLADENSASTTFTMTNSQATVTAVYRHPLTVNSGTGGGSYEAGAQVDITAVDPPAGQVFYKWVLTSGGGTLADPYSAATAYTMPNSQATVTATYVATRTLTVIGGTGGGVYTAGTQVQITADPQPGQTFYRWEVTSGGGSLANASSPTTWYTMPAGVATVTAIYRSALTVVGGSGGGSYLAGTQVDITAGTRPGQVFDKWEVTSGGGVLADENSAATTFTTPDNPATVTATYKSVLTVYGGSGSGSYAPGSQVDITAEPLPGEVFDKWVASGGGTFADANSASTTFTIANQSATVTAIYKYTLEVNGGAGSGVYAAGTQVPITAAAPPAGEIFDRWVADSGILANENNAATTFTMPDNPATVTATYEPIYTLTVEGGYGSGSYVADRRVSITAATPPAGYVFDKWESTSGGGSFAYENNSSTFYIMPANPATVKATYKLNTLTVVNGTGSGNYSANVNVPIKADTLPGRVFDRWVLTSGGGSFADATSAATTFRMPANPATVTATYKSTLTVNDGSSGGGSGVYAPGAQVRIRAVIPPAGWSFVKWETSDGGAFADENSEDTYYTMPDNPATVTAVFRGPGTNTLTVANGTGSGGYAQGRAVTITANAPPAGQVFDKWVLTSGGGSLANASSAATTYTMPNNAATVTATYKPASAATNTLTVANGTGGGSYAAGAQVSIAANAPPAGQVFDKWVLTSGGGSLANANSATTAYTMPNNAAAVTATFKAAGPADKTALNARLAAIGGTQKGNYTDASWSAFLDALAAARAAANDANATQAQVNDALSALNRAFGNLQAKKFIFTTKYESNLLNWLLFIFLFGFIWMWFA